MLEYLFTYKGKYHSGKGLNYAALFKDLKISPRSFPEKELLCVFLQKPNDSEIKALCKDFSVDEFYFRKYRNEKRSMRYSFSPLIFTLTDYFVADENIKTAHLLFIIKKNVLILVVAEDFAYYKDLFDTVITNVKQRRIKSEAYLLHQFLYQDNKETYDVIEIFDEQIITLENRIIHGGNEHEHLEEIMHLKKDLITMNRRLWATSKIIFTIKKELTNIKLSREEQALLDDIYDTLMHQIDLIETQKGNSTDLLEIYTTQISNKLAKTSNELNIIMKKMAALTIIIMVPTLIAGIYGTNFSNLPEIHWKYGYPFMMFTMLISAWITYAIFHKKKWI